MPPLYHVRELPHPKTLETKNSLNLNPLTEAGERRDADLQDLRSPQTIGGDLSNHQYGHLTPKNCLLTYIDTALDDTSNEPAVEVGMCWPPSSLDSPSYENGCILRKWRSWVGKSEWSKCVSCIHLSLGGCVNFYLLPAVHPEMQYLQKEMTKRRDKQLELASRK
jgi:hypothetical protein